MRLSQCNATDYRHAGGMDAGHRPTVPDCERGRANIDRKRRNTRIVGNATMSPRRLSRQIAGSRHRSSILTSVCFLGISKSIFESAAVEESGWANRESCEHCWHGSLRWLIGVAGTCRLRPGVCGGVRAASQPTAPSTQAVDVARQHQQLHAISRAFLEVSNACLCLNESSIAIPTLLECCGTSPA